MLIEVTLYVAGKTFKERVHARNYDEAREVALARNPNATVVSITGVFEPNVEMCNSINAQPSAYSSSQQPSYSSSGGGFLDKLMAFFGILVVGWFGLQWLSELDIDTTSTSPRTEQQSDYFKGTLLE